MVELKTCITQKKNRHGSVAVYIEASAHLITKTISSLHAVYTNIAKTSYVVFHLAWIKKHIHKTKVLVAAFSPSFIRLKYSNRVVTIF